MVLDHLPTKGHTTFTRTLEMCRSVLCECDSTLEPKWPDLW